MEKLLVDSLYFLSGLFSTRAWSSFLISSPEQGAGSIVFVHMYICSIFVFN